MNVPPEATGAHQCVEARDSDAQPMCDDETPVAAKSDDLKALWTDLLHLESAIWRELYALDHQHSPPWTRLTRRQIQGLQTTMCGLVHRLRGYREGQE